MSTIKPVTIPREVANAIETLRKGDVTSAFSNSDIAYKYADTSDRGVTATAIRKIPFDTLMRALLDGYERELTEEERVHDAIRSEWETRDRFRKDYQYSAGYADGIAFTLDVMGVTIPGINDAEGGAA